jgi:protein tyrosine/serine phosphatase
MKLERIKGFRVLGGSALFLLASFAGGVAYWQSPEHVSRTREPVRNYGVIWPHELTRSGLPRNDMGWTWLRDQGVRSIVTFRTENDVDYESFGFNVMRLPLTGSVMPTEKQAVEYLEFVQDPRNQPVHIHCTAGRDRTGMMAALVRYSIDGWKLDDALNEARQYRDGKDLSPRRVAWLRAWEKTHSPGTFKVTH